MFGDHEAISAVWPLVSSLNSMVSFYRYVSQIARSRPCTLPLDLPLGQRTGSLLFFFRNAGFYTAIFCQPKGKLTDISVDFVVI